MNLHKMIEICLKDDNMHIFVMINALICINNYVITCMNSMLSVNSDSSHVCPSILSEDQRSKSHALSDVPQAAMSPPHCFH